jgi:hypothetical protein
MLLLCALPARADITYVLENAVFTDGTTATGFFTLNVYGYLETVDIVTTAGTAASSAIMTGATYTNPASAYFFGQSPPVDDIAFGSSAGYQIVLNVSNLLTQIDSGPDPLITGSGNYPSLAGSYEECFSNTCGGPAFGDVRLLVSGDLVVPEPASMLLLIVGLVALPVIRRRRV